LESAHQRLRASKFNPSPEQGYRLDAVLVGHSRLSMLFQENPLPPDDPSNVLARTNKMFFKELPDARKYWPFSDLVCSIEYLKTFEFFHYLSFEDKKALARHVVAMSNYVTLAFFSIENGSNCTLHPDGTLPHDGKVPTEHAFEGQLHHGVIQLLRRLDMDKKEYVLLKALIVCNPAIEDLSLSHKDKLEDEREMYAKSLMSYVMWRRGPTKGPAAYTGIM
ncbi:hypothetical protein PFISCL1PPCAC_13884, partial [Pristionchus fissidentatus]